MALLKQLSKGPIDMPFLTLVVLLTGIGVITVFSASYPTAVNEGHPATYYFLRQAIFAVTGLVIMIVVSRYNYEHLRKWSYPMLLFGIGLLVLVLIPGFHTERTDHVRRWLKGPGPLPDFQPSELVKLGVILYFSARMSKRPGRRRRRYNPRSLISDPLQKLEDSGFNELIGYGLWLLVILILMKEEPHMSGTILILIPAAAILFAGGIQMQWVVIGGVTVVAALLLMMTGYQSDRILIWQDPWSHQKSGGYQIIQSLYAIGSGGLFGVGFGKGRQKQLFLPEAENDFIFSVWCEEMGLVGACVVILLFVLLILRGYWIALHSRDRFGSLLVVGITTLMAAQVFLNISVVTNFLPTTGVSLPFFSYGGTALLIQLVEMGIVLSVSRQVPPPRQE